MSGHTRERELIDAVVAALKGALGTPGSPDTAPPAAADPGGPAWLVRFTLTEPEAGDATAAIEASDAAELARRRSAGPEARGDAATASVLDRWAREAAGLLSAALGRGDVTSDVKRADPGAAIEGERVEIARAGDFVLRAAVRVVLASTMVQATPARRAGGHEPVIPDVPGAPNLPSLLDIDLPVEVRFGSAELSILELTRLAPGAVVDLQRAPDEPVELLVGDKVVARGEVVVVGGNYGVRIVALADRAERVRIMGS